MTKAALLWYLKDIGYRLSTKSDTVLIWGKWLVGRLLGRVCICKIKYFLYMLMSLIDINTDCV